MGYHLRQALLAKIRVALAEGPHLVHKGARGGREEVSPEAISLGVATHHADLGRQLPGFPRPDSPHRNGGGDRGRGRGRGSDRLSGNPRGPGSSGLSWGSQDGGGPLPLGRILAQHGENVDIVCA